MCKVVTQIIQKYAEKYVCTLDPNNNKLLFRAVIKYPIKLVAVDGECELIFEMESDKFGIAPHNFEMADHTLTQSEDIVKLAKAGDYYQIMKNVGGGGGHRLKIEDFKITIHYKPYL